MFNYELGLMTGVDLPIPEIKTVIHQPTIKEISMIGEEDFFIGIQLLTINKKMFIKDESLLDQTTNFQIFMAVINEKQVAEKRMAVEQVLTLLFPQAKIIFAPRSIILNYGEENIIIDEGNFEALQKILVDQFCLKGSGQEQYNPKGKKASEIAQKLMQSRQKIAEQKMQEQGGKHKSMFGQYLSVLTIGTGSIGLKDACNLTMYQLFDLMERYTLYLNWDIDLKSRLAGGKPDKQAENWMKDIH